MTYPRWEEYMEQGRKAVDAREYSEASALYEAALEVAERLPGGERTLRAASLGNAGVALRLLGRALPGRHEQALHLCAEPEQRLFLLNGWACALVTRGDLAAARRIFQAIMNDCAGREDELSTAVLANLARLHAMAGRYVQAEFLYKRARGVAERVLGPRHVGTARVILGMGLLYLEQTRYARAEALLRECLEMLEERLPPDHLDLAAPLLGLARLYSHQERHARALGSTSDNVVLAEPMYGHVLEILRTCLGEAHPDYLVALRAYALHLQFMDDLQRSEQLLMDILTRGLEAFGPQHPEVANSLEQGAGLLRQLKRHEMASHMEQQAREIRARLVAE